MSDWTTLVSAEDLHRALGRGDLVIVDARVQLTDRSASERAYREAHIPGAHYADLENDLSDPGLDHAGRHPWPDAGRFGAVLGRWGVTPAHQVVVYDAGDGALAAARVWFMLRTLGHRRVAVLDGGWARWRALDLPVEDAPPAASGAAPYPARFDRTRLLDADAVQAHLGGGGMLVDVRAPERFRGEVEPLDRVAGHVPGAVNRPNALNLRDGRFRPADELAHEFAQLLGGQPATQLVAMCGSGVTACHLLLALEHAGMPGGRLFTGSWSGWIDDPSRPVATGEA